MTMIKLGLAALLLVVFVTSHVEGQEPGRPFCNYVTNLFKGKACANRKRFPCGVLDWKMRRHECREFACENYRDLNTFCARRCDDLEIGNGICPSGAKCCLTADTSIAPNSLKPMDDTNSNVFEMTFVRQ